MTGDSTNIPYIVEEKPESFRTDGQLLDVSYKRYSAIETHLHCRKG